MSLKLSRSHLTIAAATAAAAVGGTTAASAADNGSSSSGTATQPTDGDRDDAAPKDRGTRGERGARLAAELAEALGVEASKVQSILEANRPERSDSSRGRPDPSALVSALAKGLSKSEADVRAALDKVRQAHQAEHEAREDAFYAAIAKALGKSAADVEAAFEAARPARPTP
jgi:hypothetical protein